MPLPLTGCPEGYTTVPRGDPGGNPTKDIMLDDQGCDGFGSRVLCCPAHHHRPHCVWYTHNNGNCEPSCPWNHIEIGSNNDHCKNKKNIRTKGYQAACCERYNGDPANSTGFDMMRMRLHSQCEWGDWPMCDSQCKNSAFSAQLALSRLGSGGAKCSDSVSADLRRPYCCGHTDSSWQWKHCTEHTNLGPGPGGSSCKSGCPDDKVRIALDKCPTGSVKATCCTAHAKLIQRRENPRVSVFRDALNSYAHDPTCPTGPEAPTNPRRRRRETHGLPKGELHQSYRLLRCPSPSGITERLLKN